MPIRSHNFWTGRGRVALTLVEVIASTVLLTTLLALLLSAASAHLRQTRRAQQRLAAVAGLDRLLSSAQTGARVPWLATSVASGVLPGVEGLAWTSRRELRHDAAMWQAEVVRIEVRETDRPAETAVAVMELLVPRLSPRSPTP
jgi:type II secretory pathway pseudopilin PulG